MRENCSFVILLTSVIDEHIDTLVRFGDFSESFVDGVVRLNVDLDGAQLAASLRHFIRHFLDSICDFVKRSSAHDDMVTLL